MEVREGKKARLPIWAKMIIAAGSVAVVFLAIFFLRDISPFNTYSIFMHRTVNSAVNDNERTDTAEERVVESQDFERLEKEVPFKVPRPLWLPEGFVLEYADYKKAVNGDCTISYKYVLDDNSDEYIDFSIRDYMPVDPDGFTVDYSEISINGMKVYIIGSKDEGRHTEYINNQGLVVTIGGTMDQETLIKIIENMS